MEFSDRPASPTLIVLTGPPAAGKSTLARLLERELAVPLISKDDLKVILYETHGWGGRRWTGPPARRRTS
ncbi:MAG: AAA family ATPase [Actinomycetota bacterium]